MIVMPAIDLRAGKCVQLVGGSYERQVIELNDPVAAAVRWSDEGFKQLHVVDLDAATGRGSNRELVFDILHATDAGTQVGGGLRTTEEVEQTLLAGADRVVVGTRALEDPEWLEEIATAFPAQIVVAMDVRGGEIVMRGWAEKLNRPIDQVLAALDQLPLAGILVTAVHREGRMKGPDMELMERVASSVTKPVQASGGISSTRDLSELARVGLDYAVIGMALYTGELNSQDVQKEMKG
jgi:phosphoribosylformimino-5-aminoimidazole carboxamide ribotide isomerase